jgi:hypothetical protein
LQIVADVQIGGGAECADVRMWRMWAAGRQGGEDVSDGYCYLLLLLLSCLLPSATLLSAFCPLYPKSIIEIKPRILIAATSYPGRPNYAGDRFAQTLHFFLLFLFNKIEKART